MKIILSRKGFDSGAGGMPSPIMPDGTLLSMPIPANNSISYDDLYYKDIPYSAIIKDLKPTFRYSCCHLDPDIRKDCSKRSEDWIAAFGQAGAALTHLNNNGVSIGDIFLFYGWFRRTEYTKGGRLRFVPNSPHLHIIYGYLQVGNILSDYDEIKHIHWHPHAEKERENDRLNSIYLPTEKLLTSGVSGYGLFNYSDELVLTKKGHPRSHWELPKCLLGKEISYHNASNHKEGYFQSAMRGQEFVVDADKHILEWVNNLIINNVV